MDGLRRIWQWRPHIPFWRSRRPPDPVDLRYPRSPVIRFLRWVALRPWWLLVGVYVVTVAPALLTALLKGTLGKQVSWTQVLLLNHIIALIGQQPWMLAPVLGGIALAGVLAWWAVADRQREQTVLRLREKQEAQHEAEQLQDRGQAVLIQQMSEQFPLLHPHSEPNTSYVPPFDETLLPVPQTFVGRSADLEWVLQRLRAGGATSITALGGMGGIGKTALAAVAARRLHSEGRFPDGIAVVLCQQHTEVVPLLQAILARFAFDRRQPQTNDLAGLLEVARERLAGKDVLVILDNVEPALPLAEIIQPLQELGTTLLLTSRQHLPSTIVPPSSSRQLELLSPEEALEVFAQALGRTTHTITLSERTAAEQIVTALERHTLAVKLAGAYVVDVRRSLDVVADELHDTKRALRLREGEATQAVGLVLAQSLATLPFEFQRLFAALAAIPTSECGRAAVLALAVALAQEPPEVGVDLLVRRALLEPMRLEQRKGRPPEERVRLHPLLRALAEEAWSSWPASEQQVIQQAVASYYVRYATATPDQELVSEAPNIEGVLEWAHQQGHDQVVVDLCLVMQNFWKVRWRTSASLRYLPWGIAAAEARSQATQQREDRRCTADLTLSFGQILRRIGRIEEAEQILTQNLQIRREIHDRQGEGEALDALGEAVWWTGQRSRAESYYKEALHIAREGHDQREEARSLIALGRICRDRGQFDQAKDWFEEALALARRVDDRFEEGRSLVWSALLLQDQGQLVPAEAIYEQALEVVRQIPNRQQEGWILGLKGQLALARGSVIEALQLYQEALLLFREVQDLLSIGWIHRHIGRVFIRQGRYEEAWKALRQARTIAKTMHYRKGTGAAMAALGELAQVCRQWKRAMKYYTIALALAQEDQNQQAEADDLYQLGRLAEIQGQFEQAEALYQTSLSFSSGIHHQRGAAASSLALGCLLVIHRKQRQKGCMLLHQAVQLYQSMGLPEETLARQALEQLGCSP